ncbi:MAG: ABC transporter ATP-binding protein [Candidatus Helarchaeota archaeon]
MVISFKELSKSYGEFDAVKSLTGTVPKGIVGFLGPNGAGKSTTFNMLMGTVRPSHGTAEVLGKDIIKDGIQARSKIGFLPERNFLYLNRTGSEFLRFVGKLDGISKSSLQELIPETLKFVGIEEKWWKKKAKFYSAGMRQRLGLAAALLNPNNELIILDEPTANLDPIGRSDILKRISDLNRKKDLNVFISSHILSEIQQICKDVIVINRGRIVLSGKIDKLANLFNKNQIKIRLSDNEVFLREIKKELSFEILEDFEYLLLKVDDLKHFRSFLNQIIGTFSLDLLYYEESPADLGELFKRIVEEGENGKKTE